MPKVVHISANKRSSLLAEMSMMLISSKRAFNFFNVFATLGVIITLWCPSCVKTCNTETVGNSASRAITPR